MSKEESQNQQSVTNDTVANIVENYVKETETTKESSTSDKGIEKPKKSVMLNISVRAELKSNGRVVVYEDKVFQALAKAASKHASCVNHDKLILKTSSINLKTYRTKKLKTTPDSDTSEQQKS